MGRYIDWADVTGRYQDFANAADSTRAEGYFIPYAEAVVDGRLAVKYTVPFSPAPYIVKDLCIDLAYYKATLRQDGSKAIGDSIEERFKSILNGELILTTSDGVLSTTGNQAWVSNTYHTSFGPDSEVLWQVDTQWVQDIQDERGQF